MNTEATNAKLCTCEDPLCWRLHPKRMLATKPELIVIREPDHRCPLGNPLFRHGEIVVCSTCGKWWRAYEPGNPDYATWKRAWVRQLFA